MKCGGTKFLAWFLIVEKKNKNILFLKNKFVYLHN